MADESESKNELIDSLHDLGENLKGLFQSAWNSPERQEIKETVNKNLHEVGDTLNKAFSDFSQSPEGQHIKAEVDDLKKRVESGELESQLRSDVLDVLKIINKKLEKASSHWSSPEQPKEEEGESKP